MVLGFGDLPKEIHIRDNGKIIVRKDKVCSNTKSVHSRGSLKIF